MDILTAGIGPILSTFETSISTAAERPSISMETTSRATPLVRVRIPSSPINGPGLDPYSVSALQVRMSFDAEGTLNDLPDGIKLGLRNDCRAPGPTYDMDDSWRSHDLQLPVHPLADKYVGREQREPDLLGPVLPAADGAIERKVDLEILAPKAERD